MPSDRWKQDRKEAAKIQRHAPLPWYGRLFLWAVAALGLLCVFSGIGDFSADRSTAVVELLVGLIFILFSVFCLWWLRTIPVEHLRTAVYRRRGAKRTGYQRALKKRRRAADAPKTSSSRERTACRTAQADAPETQPSPAAGDAGSLFREQIGNVLIDAKWRTVRVLGSGISLDREYSFDAVEKVLLRGDYSIEVEFDGSEGWRCTLELVLKGGERIPLTRGNYRANPDVAYDEFLALADRLAANLRVPRRWEGFTGDDGYVPPVD